MISANVSKETRKAVYRRDHYRCALCDSEQGLQVHHVVSRGQGGTNFQQNLITLCWRCHAVAHGTRLPEYDMMQPAEVCQACVEYVADLYTDLGFIWNPWEEHMQRWGEGG